LRFAPLRGGRDIKQVSAWLGHADAGFTLRVYVHLMDEGVGSAAFLDEAVVGTPPVEHSDRDTTDKDDDVKERHRWAFSNRRTEGVSSALWPPVFLRYIEAPRGRNG
jgi:hypothetical protein